LPILGTTHKQNKHQRLQLEFKKKTFNLKLKFQTLFNISTYKHEITGNVESDLCSIMAQNFL